MKELALFLIASVAFLTGCSDSDPWKDQRPATVPASGVITFDGEPIEGASVVFAPTEGGHAGSGMTDADGHFVLKAFPPDDGAVPGKYLVGISKTVEILAEPGAVPANADAAHALQAGGEGSNVVGWKNDLPERYSNPTKSGFTAEIPQEGTSELKFELTK